jgi:predicted acyl esterase
VLREPVDVVGPPCLELDATTTAGDADWIVKLQRIDASGAAHDLTAGWLRASARGPRRGGSRPGEPHHPHERPEAVVPGALTRYEIGLVGTAQRLLPGERLRVTLSSSDEGSAMLGFEHLVLGLAATHRVHASSVLRVPVLGGSLPR